MNIILSSYHFHYSVRKGASASLLASPLPECLAVRELRYQVKRPGFRVHEVTLVTTLVDATRYPVEEFVTLYLRRWRIEPTSRI